ncbi:MAG: biotin-dependent carboxyltransferase family protein [Tissierellia bacterium]|nr:biotin-dependent carboxyltransferase family protein [Bacillota bacterium]NLL23537.1 biotin-dependent carboxyltransferase family protein [Tissierellia bacterium]
MKHEIYILHGGLLSTIQDRGRFGFMKVGVSPAGAMDLFSLSIANLLVGNNLGEAVLETMYAGVQIEFGCDETIAITGASSAAYINESEVPLWQSLEVKKGDVLHIKSPSTGIFNYIAFSRGIAIPKIMGSKSTHLRSGIGGWKGRAIQAGDAIPLGEKMKSSPDLMLRKEKRPVYTKEKTLRVVLGPQDDHFTEEGVQTFLRSPYTITAQSDRMGYRLEGPPITHKTSADVISDGSAHGSIQVPGSAQPIVLLSDRGTTGGYAKIATLIAEDICTLSQMTPGSTVFFTTVTEQEANRLFRQFITETEKSLTSIRDPKQKQLVITVAGKEYSIKIKKLD